MKAVIILLAALALPPAHAQTAPGEAAERARIAAERQQAEVRFSSDEVACYRRFAVNDCLAEAKARRREALADLRRQELTLNDAERKRRAAERLRAIEEKSAGRAQQHEQRTPEAARSPAEVDQRQAEQARRAAERARAPASAPAKAAVPPPAVPAAAAVRERKGVSQEAAAGRARQEQEQLRRYEERLQQARERRARVEKRRAGSRPDVKPLPVPP